MTGIAVLPLLGDEIIRLVNLVAFDVCDKERVTWVDDADPLKRTIICPMRNEIPQMLQKHLRAAIKKHALTHNCYAGRIRLEGTLEVALYAQALRGPAYMHGVSPSD
jgi:hypothetical protein